MLNEQSNVEMIWGSPILDDGFTTIPNMIIRNASKLGLTGREFQFVITLASFKHDEKDPYPSQKTLADLLGTKERQIRKIVSSLEEKGLLLLGYRYINGKRSSAVYNFKPLINKCLELHGEKRLPDSKPNERIYYKTKKKSLPVQNGPVVPVQNGPVGQEQKVPVGEVQKVPPNITREYYKNEYNNRILSIYQEVSEYIGKVLEQNIDRLIDDKINIDHILSAYENYKVLIDHDNFDGYFADVLRRVLRKTKKKIGNIRNVIDMTIANDRKAKEKLPNPSKTTRKEILPDWLKERDTKESKQSEGQYKQTELDSTEDISEERRKFEELISRFNK